MVYAPYGYNDNGSVVLGPGIPGYGGALTQIYSGGTLVSSAIVGATVNTILGGGEFKPGIPGIGHVDATTGGIDVGQLIEVVKPIIPQIIALAGAAKWAALAALLVSTLAGLPWLTILAVVAGLVALGLLAKWIYDKIKARGKKGHRARRLSIGSNPRLGTLIKVAKKTDNIMLRYDKRVTKFRARIRGSGRRPAPRYYPNRRYARA